MNLIAIIVFIGIYIYLGLKKPVTALLTCPLAAITMFVLGGINEQPDTMFGAALLFVITLISILFSKYDPEKGNWPRTFVRLFLAITFFISLSITLIVLLGPLGIVGIALGIFLVGSIIAYLLTTKYSTAAYVISTIGASIRQNLPLPMALEAASSNMEDYRARILFRIKKWLVQGYSLSESIKRGYSACPGYAIAMISAAEKIDQVPLAMEAIEANMGAQANEKRRIRPVHPIYPIIVFCFMFVAVSGLMLFVIPQFATTIGEMTEMGKLPALTRSVMGITNFIIKDHGIAFLCLVIFFVLFILPMSVYLRLRPRRPDKPYLFSRIGDFLKWHLPILHWFEKNFSMVQVVEMLRLSLNAGCPVNNSIAYTITLDINNCFKKRLKNWLKKVENGDNISEAIKQSKISPSLAWAFDDKVNQGNTLSILETLEAFYRSNYSYYINLGRFIFWPCVILALGIMVCIVILSIFLPSISIITNLVQII